MIWVILIQLCGLWKHEIYELGNYLLKYYSNDLEKSNAVKKIIEIIPTDGNGVNDGGDMEQIAPLFKLW